MTESISSTTSFLKRNWVWLVFLGGLALRLLHILSQEIQYFDEGAYLQEAAYVIGLKPAAAQFYSRPGYVMALAIYRFVVADPLLAGRLLSISGFAIIFWSSWYFLPRIFSEQIRNVAVLLLAVSPLDFYLSRTILPDEFSAALFTIGVLSGLCYSKNSDPRFLYLSGFFAGCAFTAGSYRIVSVLALTGLALLILLFQTKTFKATKFAIMIGLAAIPVLVLQIKYRWINEMWLIIHMQPSVKNKALGMFRPDFVFFPFVFLILIPAFVIAVLFFICESAVLKNRFALLKSAFNPYLMLVLIAAAFTPVAFHTLLSIRAIRIISASAPMILVLTAILLAHLKTRKIALGLSLAVSVTICVHMSDKMGSRGMQHLADEIGRYHGVIEDGSGVQAPVISRTMNHDDTLDKPPWFCPSIPAICTPDYKVIEANSYAEMPEKQKAMFEVVESEIKLTVTPTFHLITHLEQMDQGGNTLAMLRDFWYNDGSQTFDILKAKKLNSK